MHNFIANDERLSLICMRSFSILEEGGQRERERERERDEK